MVRRTRRNHQHQLLLITTPDDREPAHTLTTALDTRLPWAQHLGIPEAGRQRPGTAIERAHHHLTNTHTVAAGGEYETPRALLRRREQLLDHFHEKAEAAARLDAAMARARSRARTRERSRNRDHGLEI